MSYDPREFRSNAGELRRRIPDAAQAFSQLHQTAFANGALSTATKELMALAISVAQGCEDCCGYHLDRAQHAGATEEQVAECLSVAVAMGGGPAFTYAGKVASLMASGSEG